MPWFRERFLGPRVSGGTLAVSMKILLRMLGPVALLSSLETYAGEGTELSNQLREDCGRPITVDLTDYSYEKGVLAREWYIN